MLPLLWGHNYSKYFSNFSRSSQVLWLSFSCHSSTDNYCSWQRRSFCCWTLTLESTSTNLSCLNSDFFVISLCQKCITVTVLCIEVLNLDSTRLSCTHEQRLRGTIQNMFCYSYHEWCADLQGYRSMRYTAGDRPANHTSQNCDDSLSVALQNWKIPHTLPFHQLLRYSPLQSILCMSAETSV